MIIKKAVIPAAGLGSRFLPVTKSIPKELLPLVDQPCLHHVVEEAISAGVEEFVIVTSPQKHVLEEHFAPNSYLDQWLKERGQMAVYESLKKFEGCARFDFVVQEEPLGLGHAVLCAESHIDEEFFFVILPDDIIESDIAVCQQMLEAYQTHQKPLVTVMQVPWQDVHRYGIVAATPLSDKEGAVSNIIEKPERQDAPSNLAVVGRYLLPKQVFGILRQTKPGSGGEIQLTDALQGLTETTGLHSFTFEGIRFDTGNPLGLLKASVALSLKHEKFSQDMKDFLKNLSVGL